MSSAVFFIIVLYFGLPAVAVSPILIYNFISSAVDSLLLFWLIIATLYLAVFALTVLSGLICIIKTQKSDSRHGLKIWRVQKLAAIPIYVLNFLFFCLFGVMMFPGTVITGLVSGCLCFLSVVLSGVTGIINIKRNNPAKTEIGKIHYVLQLIPVLDVISTLVLIIKLKNKTE